MQNRIDVSIVPADLQAALDAVNLIRQKLPFLIDLSIAERQALPKLGDNSRAFVQKAMEIASQNPDILPRNFDTEAMERDLELFFDLMPLLTAVARLHELLDDTLTQIGAEAMMGALLVYRQVKATEGMDTEERELAARFARKAQTGDNQTPTSP